MTNEERIRQAVIRLDSSTEGKFAREEVEEGASTREVIHSYDLSFQDVKNLRAIRRWLREHLELPN